MKKSDLFKTIIGVVALVLILLSATLGSKVVETVEKGTYQIKQAAITGTMTAEMEPGLFWQNFGSLKIWQNQFTFFFTHDKEGDESFDQSIEVRFVDGSKCNLSGTVRVIMPTNEKQAIALMTEENYSSVEDIRDKLILPTVRDVLRATANMMTAQESYAAKRIDYTSWAKAQIEKGLYDTTDEVRDVVDVVSGKTLKKTFKVIKREKAIDPKTGKEILGGEIHLSNPLAGIGVQLKNFSIKSFQYAPEVVKQIADQQKALMAVATAKANAQKAEQDKLTIEAQGKAAVAKAKYEKEKEKVRAVVDAQKVKEVAITIAEKKMEEAKLAKDAAEYTKKEQILLGEGEAERKRLVLKADGALAQKLATVENIHKTWANAHATRPVPQVVFGGSGGSDMNKDSLAMSDVLSLMAVKQLGLDLTIPKK